MSIAYYNGEFSSLSDIKIPLTDRALFFGDGIYEALIARNGRAHLLEKHLERFYRNAELLGIPCYMGREALTGLINEALFRSGEETALIYFQMTRFSERRAHAVFSRERSNFLLTVTAQPMPDIERRIRLVTYPDLRYKYCNIKTLNLLPSVIAADYAERNQADEAVFLRDGIVTECSHSNISALINGVLYTHPKNELILPGIAREELLSECKRLGIPHREEAFSAELLYSADALIVTSSTRLASLAESIDRKNLPSPTEKAIELVENLYENFINFTN